MGSDHTMDTAQQPPAESNLTVKRRNIEAIYPLRPIQKALMLYADTGTGAGEVADPGSEADAPAEIVDGAEQTAGQG